MPHLLDEELDAIRAICERDGRAPGVAETLAVVELADEVRLSGEFVQDTSMALTYRSDELPSHFREAACPGWPRLDTGRGYPVATDD